MPETCLPETPSFLDEEEVEKNLKISYKRREYLDFVRIGLGNSLDKYLLSFSTGSLYLSVAFSKEQSSILILLLYGWFFLILSIITALLSILYSSKAHKEQINIVDRRINAYIKKQVPNEETNRYNYTVEALRNYSIGGFILGICFLAIFYFLNL